MLFTIFILAGSSVFFLLQHPVLIEKLAAMRKFIKEEISRHRKTFNLHSPYDLIDLYIESKKKGADISGMYNSLSYFLISRNMV